MLLNLITWNFYSIILNINILYLILKNIINIIKLIYYLIYLIFNILFNTFNIKKYN